MSFAIPDALIKGWCPGTLRPMASGDGLIVRLRLTAGIVDVSLALRIAAWSRKWGNGQIDLSNRANLQLRGLSERHLPELHAALADEGLLDGSQASEAVRNVLCSPLAGCDPDAVLDVRPIARRLEQRLACDTALHDLPAKFGFAVDDGGFMGLGDVAADVRFLACHTQDGPAFTCHLAGAPHLHLGPCHPSMLVDTAEALARVFLRLRTGREADIRRMRDLVATHGAEAIAQAASLGCIRSGVPDRKLDPSAVLGVHELGAAAFVGVGVAFGRITADGLAELALRATGSSALSLRLTPWRAILLPVPSLDVAHALSISLADSGLILDPHDNRRRIATCPGAPACVRATTSVRDDAASLAKELPKAPGGAILIHVSGCEKGCAHPKPAPVTLIGRNGGYDLVRDGVASGPPSLCNLTPAQAAEQLRHLMAHALQVGAT